VDQRHATLVYLTKPDVRTPIYRLWLSRRALNRNSTGELSVPIADDLAAVLPNGRFLVKMGGDNQPAHNLSDGLVPRHSAHQIAGRLYERIRSPVHGAE
jgi:hypothetical protein